MHGSLPPELLSGTDVNVASKDGRGGIVLVIAGVFVNVAVGGTGVAVGMAACVSATMVKAAAAIVFWMSTGLTVGEGVSAVPHALTVSAIISTSVRIENHFMWISPYHFSVFRSLRLLRAIPVTNESPNHTSERFDALYFQNRIAMS